MTLFLPSSSSETLRPLSFRPSHVTPAYYVGSAADAHRWHQLVVECRVRIIVNCCAQGLGALVFEVPRASALHPSVPEPPIDDGRQRVRRCVRSFSYKGGPKQFIMPECRHDRNEQDPDDNVTEMPAEALRAMMLWSSDEFIALSSRTLGCCSVLEDQHTDTQNGTSAGGSERNPSTVRYLEISLPLRDDVQFPLLPWLHAVCPVLVKLVPVFQSHKVGEKDEIGGREEACVFIHCAAGVSRSVGMFIGCVLAQSLEGCVPIDRADDADTTVRRIIDWLRTRRRFASPNPGFVLDLSRYVEALRMRH